MKDNISANVDQGKTLTTDNFLFPYLIVSTILEDKLSGRAEKLFKELLKTYLTKRKQTFEISYRLLECDMQCKADTIRSAFRELEKHKLASRNTIQNTKTLRVTLNIDVLNAYKKDIPSWLLDLEL